MLAAWLVLALQGPAVSLPHDLLEYLALAARYRTSDRGAAVQEILRWRRGDIDAAVKGLKMWENFLTGLPADPADVDFRTVEAAVLMHANAGLVSLKEERLSDAETHLAVSVWLFEWSRGAAQRLGRRAAPSRTPAVPPSTPPTSPSGIRARIQPRDYYLTLATSCLFIGFPGTARSFAEQAVRVAPMDAEVRLVSGCVLANLALEHLVRHQDSDAARARDEAERALRDALLLDRGLLEARLRLGKLLADERRTIEAEALLAEVDETGADDRQRYLARLLLGRIADRQGHPDEALRLYRRALEAWPDSQAARLALGLGLEKSTGPAAARALVAGSLAASRRLDRTADPWWQYPTGPPGLANALLYRVWTEALER